MQIKTNLYFAYGSNLNIEQMRQRAPHAEPIGPLYLRGWRLVFRGVADVIEDHRGAVWGGVWRITEDDEKRLDIYEGVRGGLYKKVYLPIKPFHGQEWLLIYVMNSDGIFPPSQGYLEGIEEGYGHFGLDGKARKLLDRAVQESWDDKRPSEKERKRYLRKGYPKLARPKNDCANCGFCPRKPKTEPKQRMLRFHRHQDNCDTKWRVFTCDCKYNA